MVHVLMVSGLILFLSLKAYCGEKKLSLVKAFFIGFGTFFILSSFLTLFYGVNVGFENIHNPLISLGIALIGCVVAGIGCGFEAYENSDYQEEDTIENTMMPDQDDSQ